MRYNKTFNSFISGEISDKLRARTDTDHYAQGVSDLINFTPSTAGGAFKRKGTTINTVYNIPAGDAAGLGSPTSAAAPFLFSVRRQDVDGVLGIDSTGGNIYTITGTGTASSITTTAFPINFGSWKISSVSYSGTDLSRHFYRSFTNDGNTDITQTKYIQIPANDDVNPLNMVDENPFSFICMKDGTLPILFGRVDSSEEGFAHNILPAAWPKFIASTTYNIDPRCFMSTPYETQNTDTTVTMAFSSAGGGGAAGVIDAGLTGTGNIIEITLSGVTLASEILVPGMFVIVDHNTAAEGVLLVTSVNANPLKVNALVIIKLNGTAATFRWARSKWYTGNWPACLCIFQGRLLASGVKNSPDEIYFSQTDQYFNFFSRRLAQDTSTDTSVLGYFGDMVPSSPFSKRLVGSLSSKVQWMFPDDILRVGTSTGDWEISSGTTTSNAITSTQAQIERRSGNTASSTSPIYCDDSIVYTSNDGSQVRAIDSKNIGVSYKNTNLSILTDTTYPITNSYSLLSNVRIENIPDKNILCSLWNHPEVGNFLLFACLYKHANVIAFHKSEFPTDFIVKDVCSGKRGTNRLFISGTINTYPVVMEYDPLQEGSEEYSASRTTVNEYRNGMVYLDCAVMRNLITSSSAVTTANLGLTGKDFFSGERVSIWYDGRIIHNIKWNGSYTLPRAANIVYVGFPYQATLRSLIIENTQNAMNSAGNLMRIDSVTAHLYKSSSGTMGFEEDNMVSMELDETEEVTLDKPIDFPQSADIEPRVIIKSKIGLPLNILGMTIRGVSYEG